jgi:hypothetical protein
MNEAKTGTDKVDLGARAVGANLATDGYGIRSPSFSKGFRLQPLGGESLFSGIKSAVSGGNPPQAVL